MLNLAVNILTYGLTVIESMHDFFLFKHGCHVGRKFNSLHSTFMVGKVLCKCNEIYIRTIMDSLWPVLNKPLSCRMMQSAMLVVNS